MYALGDPRTTPTSSMASAWEPMRTQFSQQLEATGRWHCWAETEPEISWPASLDAATRDWRGSEKPDSHLLVAALTRHGSHRGGDDEDAALAVVFLLEQGIRRVASQLSDICGIEDVVTATWEEVKNAEPQLGCRAPRFLLKRAKQRLLRPAAGLICRQDRALSLDALLETDSPRGWADSREENADARRELEDLLDWARVAGVLEPAETDFLVELTDVSQAVATRAEATELSVRHGVSPRTIRRRKADAVKRLRTAVPDYLAATA